MPTRTLSQMVDARDYTAREAVAFVCHDANEGIEMDVKGLEQALNADAFSLTELYIMELVLEAAYDTHGGSLGGGVTYSYTRAKQMIFSKLRVMNQPLEPIPDQRASALAYFN